MIEVRQTAAFARWIESLKDLRTRARIAARVRRLEEGKFGDVEPVGEGISELRIHYGPGYRLYITRRGETVVILLCGGDKRTQNRDIAKAKALAAEMEQGP